MQKPLFYPVGTPLRLVSTEYTGRTSSRRTWLGMRRVTIELRQTFTDIPTGTTTTVKTSWRDATLEDLIAMGEQLRATSA